MKKIIVLLTMLMVVMVCNAQEKKDVTTFMGIPVDGTKSEMIQKLKNKGFHEVTDDFLEGEFNGYNVLLQIKTYKEKVSAIDVVIGGVTGYDESWAKIIFNNLSKQFERSLKYVTCKSHLIGEGENISYEMLVNSKTYMNVYIQNGDKMKPVGVSMVRISDEFKYHINILYVNTYNVSNDDDL